MPEFNTEIDIDPSEFWDSCSENEKEELVDIIIDEGYARKITGLISHTFQSVLEEEWDETVYKLADLRLRLTPEEEETIKKIVNKYD